MNKRKGVTAQSGARKKKKKYERPELRMHGDIREITKAKGGTRTDGSGQPKTKTTSGP
jgi:hypothetical protein